MFAGSLVTIALASLLAHRDVLRPSRDLALGPLVEAVGKRRFLEPRLTGGFRWGERVSEVRGADAAVGRTARGPGAGDWRVLAAAAQLGAAVARTSENAPALATAHLLVGSADEAIAVLERASSADPKDARILSDLAAALLQRAKSQDRPGDYPLAVESSSRAIELDPALPEARFNQALALEELGLRHQAIESWTRFGKVETDADWRAEGERHAEDLKKRSSLDLRGIKARIWATLTSERPLLVGAVAANPTLARDVLEMDLLGQRDVQLAARLAEVLADVTTDPSFGELALSLRTDADPAWRRLYSEARRQYQARNFAYAHELFQRIRRGPRAYTAWARLYELLSDEQAQPAASLETLDAAIGRAGRSPVLLGFAWWQRGILLGRTQRFREALEAYDNAGANLSLAGMSDLARYQDHLRAEVLNLSGDPGSAWKLEIGVIEHASALSNPGHRWSVFATTASQSARRGNLRTAEFLLAEGAVVAGDTSLSIEADRVALAARIETAKGSGGSGEFEKAALLARGIRDASERARQMNAVAFNAANALGGALMDETIERLLGSEGSPFLSALLFARAGRREREGDQSGAIADLELAVERLPSIAPSDRLDLSVNATTDSQRIFDTLARLKADKGDYSGAYLATEAFRAQTGLCRDPDPTSLPHPPRGTVILSQARFGDALLSSLFTSSGPAFIHSPLSPALKAALDSRTPLSEADLAVMQQDLLGPHLGSFADGDKVIIVPHGSLTHVPYHVLLATLSGREGHGTRRPLVAYSPCAPTRRAEGILRKTTLVLVPDAEPPLPEARGEAAQIAARGAGVTLKMGREADAASLMEGRRSFGVVHFAGHAFANSRSPLLASLQLGDREEFLPFGAQAQAGGPRSLLFLSSCRGAMPQRGLSALSIAAGFLRLGFDDVVATMDDAPDIEISRLAVRFHEELDRSGRLPLHALAATQAWARNQRQAAVSDWRKWGLLVAYTSSL